MVSRLTHHLGARPGAGVYVAIGVTVNGERDILGLWAGDGSEGAKCASCT
jgi:transposase-like protein